MIAVRLTALAALAALAGPPGLPRQPDADLVLRAVRSYRADRVQYRIELSRSFPDRRTQLTEFTPVFESGA